MPVIDSKIKPNTDYPHANYRVVKIGKGAARHAALWFDHNNWTKAETVCGRDWFTVPATGEIVEDEATCKRCTASLSKIDRERRRLDYMVRRDEELDALTYGVPADQATAWRDEWYAKANSGKATQ